MVRYFFHIRDGERLIEDEEGVDVPEMPDTAAQLTKAAMEVISEEEWSAERTADRSFEVTDAVGRVILVIPFGTLRESP